MSTQAAALIVCPAATAGSRSTTIAHASQRMASAWTASSTAIGASHHGQATEMLVGVRGLAVEAFMARRWPRVVPPCVSQLDGGLGPCTGSPAGLSGWLR